MQGFPRNRFKGGTTPLNPSTGAPFSQGVMSKAANQAYRGNRFRRPTENFKPLPTQKVVREEFGDNDPDTLTYQMTKGAKRIPSGLLKSTEDNGMNMTAEQLMKMMVGNIGQQAKQYQGKPLGRPRSLSVPSTPEKRPQYSGATTPKTTSTKSAQTFGLEPANQSAVEFNKRLQEKKDKNDLFGALADTRPSTPHTPRMISEYESAIDVAKMQDEINQANDKYNKLIKERKEAEEIKQRIGDTANLFSMPDEKVAGDAQRIGKVASSSTKKAAEKQMKTDVAYDTAKMYSPDLFVADPLPDRKNFSDFEYKGDVGKNVVLIFRGNGDEKPIEFKWTPSADKRAKNIADALVELIPDAKENVSTKEGVDMVSQLLSKTLTRAKLPDGAADLYATLKNFIVYQQKALQKKPKTVADVNKNVSKLAALKSLSSKLNSLKHDVVIYHKK